MENRTRRFLRRTLSLGLSAEKTGKTDQLPPLFRQFRLDHRGGLLCGRAGRVPRPRTAGREAGAGVAADPVQRRDSEGIAAGFLLFPRFSGRKIRPDSRQCRRASGLRKRAGETNPPLRHQSGRHGKLPRTGGCRAFSFRHRAARLQHRAAAPLRRGNPETGRRRQRDARPGQAGSVSLPHQPPERARLLHQSRPLHEPEAQTGRQHSGVRQHRRLQHEESDLHQPRRAGELEEIRPQPPHRPQSLHRHVAGGGSGALFAESGQRESAHRNLESRPLLPRRTETLPAEVRRISALAENSSRREIDHAQRTLHRISQRASTAVHQGADALSERGAGGESSAYRPQLLCGVFSCRSPFRTRTRRQPPVLGPRPVPGEARRKTSDLS